MKKLAAILLLALGVTTGAVAQTAIAPARTIDAPKTGSCCSGGVCDPVTYVVGDGHAQMGEHYCCNTGTELYENCDKGPAGSGEANTASNVGSGEDIFKQKTGVDLEFKGITNADSSCTIATVGDNITIDCDGGGGSITVREVDLSPSVGSVTTIEFDQADGFVVSDQTGGVVQVDLDALPGANVSGAVALATTATTANAGDSATAFFSSGTVEHEYGGLEADVSLYNGLIRIASGSTTNVTNLAGLNTALGSSIADGAHTTARTDEEITDLSGGMVTGNTETLITVTFQDIDNTIDFVVEPNLSNYTNDAGFLTAEVDGSTSNELQNLFQTIDAPAGTDPVADGQTDTLQLLAGSSTLTITGDSVADSVTFEVIDVACTGCLGSTEIAGLDASDTTTGEFGDSLVSNTLTHSGGSIALESLTVTAVVDDEVLVGSGAASAAFVLLPDCDNEANTLGYDQATNSFVCNADAGAGGGMTSWTVADDNSPTGDVTVDDGEKVQFIGGEAIDTTIGGSASAPTITVSAEDAAAGNKGVIQLTGDLGGTAASPTVVGVQANSVALATDTTGNYVADITGGDGLTASGGGSENATITIATASTEANFLADGGVTGLTCGAAAQGKIQVMDNGDLQFCDGATTSVLQTIDISSYLTAEVNDLSAAVTWVNVPDANITSTSVTQHETALEGVLDLPDLQGAVTDAQVPNNITIDLATTATTANAGDSATAFFSAGTIEHEYGGLEADVSLYSGLIRIAAGATSNVTNLSGLNTALGSSIADGAHTTARTDEEITDLAGGMVTGNTETLITVTFQDIDNTIDFAVEPNLSNYTNDAGFLTAEVDGSTTNEIQNLFQTIDAPSGTDPVADSATDTLQLLVGSSTMTITGDSVADTLTFTVTDVSCTGCLGSTEIAALDAGDVTTGEFADGQVSNTLTHSGGSIALESLTVTSVVDDEVLVGSGAGTAAFKLLPDCDSEAQVLGYDQATNSFVCTADAGAGGGMTSWTLADDASPTGDKTVDDGEKVQFLEGEGIDVTIGGTDGAPTMTVAAEDASGANKGVVQLSGDLGGTAASPTVTGVQANAVALATDTTGNYVADLTGGFGITVSGGGSENATITVDVNSQEAGFLADGGAVGLTCGGGNQGKMQVMDDGTLQFCDGATTSSLQTVYTGAHTTDTNANTLCTGTTTYLDGEGNCDDISSVYAASSHNHAASEITSGTLLHERGGLEADVSAYNGLIRIASGATSNVTNLTGLNTALGSSIADGAHTTDTTCNGVACTLNDDTIVLVDAVAPTTDGQIQWDSTTEVIEVGDDGVATLQFYPGVHTTDTSANTICAGTTTYLDGEGNCDDISSVYEAEGEINATAVTGNASAGAVLFGTGASAASWDTTPAIDCTDCTNVPAASDLNDVGNVTLTTPGDGAVLCFTGTSNNSVDCTVGGDLTATEDAGTWTAAIAANAVALATDTTGNYVADLTGGAGIAVSGGGSENATITVTTASQETGFIADGGAVSLTCGGGTAGQMQVMDDGTLEACDGAATPALSVYVPSDAIRDADTLRIGASTYGSIQDLQTVFHSSGVTGGGTITDDTDGTITVSAGTGLIRSTNAIDGDLYWFDWAAESGANVALTDSAMNYIYVEYNAGSPQVIATVTERTDLYTNVLLGTVYRSGTTLHITEDTRAIVGDHALKMIERMKSLAPFAHESGAILSGSNLDILLTAGAFWEGLTRFTTPAFDTSGVDVFTYYYRDGVGGWTSVASQSAIDNTQYDDGDGTLGTLSNNKFGNHWVYIDGEGETYVLYGWGDYSTLADAEAAAMPSSTPPFFSESHAKLVGRVTVQKSAASFTEVVSAFDTTFSGGIASDHGGLTGLGDDDHPQYLLINGTRAMTGLLTTDNFGIEFEESDTNPTCTTGNYNIFADLSETAIKVCNNGAAAAVSTGSHTTDTNANTICTGTTTYLDGEGNCDDISGVYAAAAHNHDTSAITTGTLVHERGGLEADISAYNGLIRIASGVTSNITNLSGLNTALGSSIADGAHTTDTTCNGVACTLNDDTIVLLDAAAPTTDGQIQWDSTTEVIEVGDDGVATLQFFPGAHTTDTNANTVCAGTTTYLDGEGNCDDISGVYAATSHNHAASAITSGTLVHERGGLEADVSGYNGLVRISSGATSSVTNLTALNTALGSSIADGAHTTDTTCNGVACTLSDDTIVLLDAVAPTTDGQIQWDSTTEVIEVGDDGVATLQFFPGAHTTDTNANTVCAGTTTYLDGEGNCDDISSVYEAEGQINATNVTGDASSAAVLFGTGASAASWDTTPAIDCTDCTNIPAASDLNDIGNVTLTTPGATHFLAFTGTGNASANRAIVDGDIPNNITIDLAATATALASDPSDCSANQFANAIAASGNLTCAGIADADVPDTITVSNYLPLAGGTMTGNITLNDGTTDSPSIVLTPQTGTSWSAFVADTDDDLRIEANTASTETIELENIGAGVTNLVVDGTITSGGVAVSTGSHFSPNADPSVDHSSYVAGHGDGANCAAGEVPAGVDAAGAVQGCYEPTGSDLNGGTISGVEITLTTGTGPQVDGRLKWDTTNEVLHIGDDGVATLHFLPVGVTTPFDATNHGLLIGNGTEVVQVTAAVPDCDTNATDFLDYDQATQTFSCTTISGLTNTMLADDTIDFDKIIDTPTLDTDWIIGTGTGNLNVEIQKTASEVSSSLLMLTPVLQDDADATDYLTGLRVDMTNQSGDNDAFYGIHIIQQNNAATGQTRAGMYLQNLDTDASSMPIGLLLETATGSSGTAIDASDTDWGDAIDIGANPITFSTGSLSATDLELLDDGTITLTSEVTGTLPFGNGGTGLSSASDDTVMVSSGSAWVASAIPDCNTDAGDRLQYDTATNAFSCKSRADQVLFHIIIEDPVDADYVIFKMPNFSGTITGIYCESEAATSATISLCEGEDVNDDTCTTNILSPATLACTTTEASETGPINTAFSARDRHSLLIESVSGTPGKVEVMIVGYEN